MCRQTYRSSKIGAVGFLCALVGVLAMRISSAAAQSSADMLRIPDPSAFFEAFLDQPPQSPSRGSVVGVTIVGVRLEGPTAPFDPASLRVRLGDAPAPSQAKLCLKVISRDGRYFARGQYNVGGETGPAPLVEYRTAYGKLLAGYSNRDVATSAFRAANCNDQTKAEWVAAQLTSSIAADRLVVQVRAGEARVRAQLLRDNAPLTQPVLCGRLQDGPTVGFTGECAIALPDGLKSGRYQLSIGETASTGEIKVKTYPIFLWLGK